MIKLLVITSLVISGGLWVDKCTYNRNVQAVVSVGG